MDLQLGLKVVLIVVSYFVGNLSPAIIISKGIYGTDVRTLGSGNAGTTNMLRNFGKKAAGATLLVDALKAVPCVIAANYIVGDQFGMWCGLAVIVGHIWPVCFGFKGGKGVATTLGTGLAVAPGLALVSVLIGLAVMALSKRISPGSILGIASFPVLVLITGDSTQQLVWGALTALIICFMHRANIVRILKGQEPKFSLKK